MWLSKIISLRPYRRGFHLITNEVEGELFELTTIKNGLLNLFLQHTSASLSINENADPTVCSDLESAINHIAPENQPFYKHTYEGVDDMPAHIKSGLLGVSLILPIHNGKLALGAWQGIYLGEHRNNAGQRKIIATLNGDVF